MVLTAMRFLFSLMLVGLVPALRAESLSRPASPDEVALFKEAL